MARTPITGKLSGISGVETQLIDTTAKARYGTQIFAPATNTESVYIGVTGLTAGTDDDTDGFPIEAGGTFLDKRRSPSDIYVIAPSGDQELVYAIY